MVECEINATLIIIYHLRYYGSKVGDHFLVTFFLMEKRKKKKVTNVFKTNDLDNIFINIIYKNKKINNYFDGLL